MMAEDSTGARAAGREDAGASANTAETVQRPTAELRNLAADSRLTEDLALKLLERRDLNPVVLEAMAANASVMKHRRVIVAVVAHPKTPRYVSLPIARRLYTFEMMKVAQTPALAAHLKLAIEEAIISRLETVSAGERLTLAKQGSTRVAGALLLDPEMRVVHAALQNTRMTERYVVRAIMRAEASAAFIQAVCAHARWSLRREVQLALLRNEHTPLAKALQFARTLPKSTLREVLQHSRLPANTKAYLTAELGKRKS